jgi:glycerophosphoryl diester phosphodiesterase
MDVNITRDRHIVVIHDTTVNGRTNGSGRVNELTLAQIKKLDAAHHWPEYRGIALGQKPPPPGFKARDFKVPALREVLRRYPNMLMNIEIKGDSPDLAPQGYVADLQAGRPTILDAADELAKLLGKFKRFGNTMVVSFSDVALTRFEQQADRRIDTAAALGTTAAFFGTTSGPLPGAPHPWKEALQPPTFFSGIEVPTQDFVTDAHRNGLAVHVWLNDDSEEAPPTYGRLVRNGVDGIMTDRPSRLEAFLAGEGVRWTPPKKTRRQ